MVVGGGPAGAVTATLLSCSQVPVLLVERGGYEERPEIDVLPPEIQIELRRLEVWDRFLLANPMPCEAIQSAWGHPLISEQHFIRNPYGCGWCVRRSWFDGFLAEEARKAGSDLVTQARVTRLARVRGEWRLDLATRSGDLTVRSDFLVDASGAGASLARMLGARRITLDGMVGLSRLFPPLAGSRSPDPVLLIETDPLGWWYSVQIDPEELLVTFVTQGSALRGNPAARERIWQLALAGAPRTRCRVERCGEPGALWVRPSPLGRLDRAAGDGWLAVGDAASTFDPLSGSGLRKALADAERAAMAVQKMLSGASDALSAYAIAVEKSFSSHLRTREEYYRRERRWPHSAFWSGRSRTPLRRQLLP